MTRTAVVAGATGHVGRALVDRLATEGRPVRALTRDANGLAERSGVTPVEGDIANSNALDDLFVSDCVAYFLVHALDVGGELVEEERKLAQSFAEAAERAGANRIVYLGGLVNEREDGLSPHMEARLAAGRALRTSSVPCIEFRASIVIGDGSFSFELIRKLVQFAPVVALPGWADNLAQPIALEDVVSYLVAAADVAFDGSTVVEIGGADQLSYRRLIELVGDLNGTHKTTVTVPVPGGVADAAGRASKRLLDELPGDAQEAIKLLEGLRHESVVRDYTADGMFAIQPMGIEAAIVDALS